SGSRRSKASASTASPTTSTSWSMAASISPACSRTRSTSTTGAPRSPPSPPKTAPTRSRSPSISETRRTEVRKPDHIASRMELEEGFEVLRGAAEGGAAVVGDEDRALDEDRMRHHDLDPLRAVVGERLQVEL